MAYIVKYIKQSDIDFAERYMGRRMTALEVEAKKQDLKVDTEKGADRLVEHLRSTGCIATAYDEHELQ
jgi:hypothetical protein